MKSYCLYCRTGAEQKLVYLLKKDVRDYLGLDAQILYPTRVMNQKKRGEWKRVEQPLLPGYVFIYLEEEVAFPVFIIQQERDAYKILRNLDGTMELKGSDAQYASWVFNHGGKFEPSTVVLKENQIVKVLDGPLQDLQGRVTKLDRHHKRVIVAFTFAGVERKVNLSVNIIEAGEE